MGRVTINEILESPFEISVNELIALQKLVVRRRSRHPKQHVGAALAQSKIRGRGMDFVETRNYFPGDDIRLMDWRVTARTNKPHVKIFQVERERPVMVFYDLAPSMFFGTKGCLKSVIAAKLAALLAWTARTHGDRVGGVISSLAKQNLWLPHAHNQTLINFLKAVSDASGHYQDPAWTDWNNQNIENVFIRSLKELLKTLKPGTLILLISDWNYNISAIQSYMLELRQHHDMIMYHVCDPIELIAPKQGLYPISDGRDVATLNFHSSPSRDDYQKFCEEKLLKVQKLAKKIAMPYQLVTVDTDLTNLVHQSLLRRLGA